MLFFCFIVLYTKGFIAFSDRKYMPIEKFLTTEKEEKKVRYPCA